MEQYPQVRVKKKEEEQGLYGYELNGSIFILDNYCVEKFRSASVTWKGILQMSFLKLFLLLILDS